MNISQNPGEEDSTILTPSQSNSHEAIYVFCYAHFHSSKHPPNHRPPATQLPPTQKDIHPPNILRVHVRTEQQPPEVQISKHLNAIQNSQAGKNYVRLVIDSCDVFGPHGVHLCLLYQPAGIDIRDYTRCLEGDALPARVIHTDIQPNNILLGIDDISILASMEKDEFADPAPRKPLAGRTIYATRAMPLTGGQPILADLGEARLTDGRRQTVPIMPSVYRAPEVTLGLAWDEKVDIWALGQTAWTLFEQGHLFQNRDLEDDTDHAVRFAEMISLMGAPPVEFLRRSGEGCKRRGSAAILEQSLESQEAQLKGNEKMLFLRFLRNKL
ncbi:kinase-like protein [Aspergillus ellipticus CBS 707.79]|uniref:Kinase-like protein n=1 Tax=Aspergillus ellipticus CBS 707.79 TaxID=1448320 RepID=A0A319CYC2_9EURO|nr:kinase-like protein [Aspergillus ellipticus CBS 707.79]